MNVTMADIAAKLGISESSVSLALSNSPRVAEATRKRVHEAAEEMGYRTNPYISALMTARRHGKAPKKPPVIALVTATITPDEWEKSYNVSEFIQGCTDVARNLGMRLEHFWLGDEKLSSKRLNDMFFHRGIRGAVLVVSGRCREKLIYPWSNMATVSYGINETTPVSDWVTSNHFGNMEIILSVLKEQNYTRLGFAMETPYIFSNYNRWLAAYKMDQSGLPEDTRLEPWLVPDPTFEGFKAWFDRVRPEVVICVRPPKVIEWLEQMGLRVPDDVGVVTIGTAKPDGKFSGIAEKSYASGKLALEMLLERIHHNEFDVADSPHHITVSGQWVRGETLLYRD